MKVLILLSILITVRSISSADASCGYEVSSNCGTCSLPVPWWLLLYSGSDVYSQPVGTSDFGYTNHVVSDKQGLCYAMLCPTPL